MVDQDYKKLVTADMKIKYRYYPSRLDSQQRWYMKLVLKEHVVEKREKLRHCLKWKRKQSRSDERNFNLEVQGKQNYSLLSKGSCSMYKILNMIYSK